MELRQGDLSLSELIMLQQRLVNQDVLGLHEDKCAYLNKKDIHFWHGKHTLLLSFTIHISDFSKVTNSYLTHPQLVTCATSLVIGLDLINKLLGSFCVNLREDAHAHTAQSIVASSLW